MAYREGRQVDTLPSQMYGKYGSSIKSVNTDSNGNLVTANLGNLVPYDFDYISLTPPDKPTTIVYKSGGVSGTTVATLTLTYTGDDIATITRT